MKEKSNGFLVICLVVLIGVVWADHLDQARVDAFFADTAPSYRQFKGFIAELTGNATTKDECLRRKMDETLKMVKGKLALTENGSLKESDYLEAKIDVAQTKNLLVSLSAECSDHDHDHEHEDGHDHDHDHEEGHSHDHKHPPLIRPPKSLNGSNSTLSSKFDDQRKEKWLYSIISAVIISVVGVMCVVVVPLINTFRFNYLFQFLVSLAVGTLSGDALLHLIPHAFSEDHGEHGHSESHGHGHDHSGGVYKGLGAVVGIYVFFLIEKIMQIRRARKERRHRETELAHSDKDNEFPLMNHASEHDHPSNGGGADGGDVFEEKVKLDIGKLMGGSAEAGADGAVVMGLDLVPVVAYSRPKLSTSDGATSEKEEQQQQPCLVIHANKDLKYISKYLPNNKCEEDVDHHDHENEIEHLHQHSNRNGVKQNAGNGGHSRHASANHVVSVQCETRANSKDLDDTNAKLLETTANSTTTTSATTTPAAAKSLCLCVVSPTPTAKSSCNSHEECDARDATLATATTTTAVNSDKSSNNTASPDNVESKNPVKRTVSKTSEKSAANSIHFHHHHHNHVHSHGHGHSHSHVHHSHHSHGHSHLGPIIGASGSGHSHSHLHNYKSTREKAHHDHHKKHEKEISSIKLIAWMVIMGDGLHNFSDGLAIGASFANSITAGVGTSIAVLFHELPHEIGDFAVLRRAGVSLKRALIFNALSGILCLLGVVVGLLIGEIQQLANWSLLFTAGVFLYISLVDMIPELSEDKEDDSIINFLIQAFGILVGVGIMLLIALFEGNINSFFS